MDLAYLQVPFLEKCSQHFQAPRGFTLQLLFQLSNLLLMAFDVQLLHHIALHSCQLDEYFSIFLCYFNFLLLLEIALRKIFFSFLATENISPLFSIKVILSMSRAVINLSGPGLKLVGHTCIKKFVSQNLIFIINFLLDVPILSDCIYFFILEMECSKGGFLI